MHGHKYASSKPRMRNPAPAGMRNSFDAVLSTAAPKNLNAPRVKDSVAGALRPCEMADIAQDTRNIIWRSGKQFISINGRLTSLSDLKRRNRG
jgi:hypothetical protein